MTNPPVKNNIAIIGAGPAGLAAAIQLQRSGCQPIVLEKNVPGGLLRQAHCVENYPGFPAGLPGIELAEKMVDQARNLSVRIEPCAVTDVTWQDDQFRLTCGDGTLPPMIVRYLIVASGTAPRALPVPLNPADMIVAAMPSELPQIRNGSIGIIGAGDAAFDYALHLSEQNRVTILNRGPVPRCLPLLWERSRSHGQIDYRANCQVQAIGQLIDGRYRLTCSTKSRSQVMEFDEILSAIGREPVDKFIQIPDELRQQLVREQRLHFAGDVKNGIFRQCAIATGDGLRCAMTVFMNVVKEIDR